MVAGFPDGDTHSGIVRKAKATARQAARTVRLAAWQAGGDAGVRLATRLAAEMPKAGGGGDPAGTVVAAYWPVDDEIDISPAIHDLHSRGHAVCLPVVARRGAVLRFRRWRPETALVAGAYGIPAPPETEPDCVPDVLLVPLLAFDRRGRRLGYGGGFYDRTLQALRRDRPVTAVGVGFAAQEVAAVPCDRFDQPLDGVITEAFSFWLR